MGKVLKLGTHFELPVPTLYEKKVRAFYPNLNFSADASYLTNQVNGVSSSIDEEVSEILGVPTKGTKSLRNENDSKKVLKICGKLDAMNIKNMIKKALKGEYQLLTKKRTIVIGPDLFLIFQLFLLSTLTQ